MHRFLYCEKIKKSDFLYCQKKETGLFLKDNQCNIKMDEHNSKYPRMDWDAKDLPLAFKSFKEHCNFMFGGPLKSKSEEEKCNYVMLWSGEKGCNIYSTWTLTNEERKQLAIHYEHFENYCKPKSNKIYSRYIFMRREQGTDEPFEQFVTDLKLLYKECGYDHAMEDEMMRPYCFWN